MLDLLKKMSNKKRFIVFVLVVTVFKIILMGLFSSDYENQLFIPFVTHYLKNPLENPYNYYNTNKLPLSFPYPPLMLFIESTGGSIINTFSGMPVFLTNIVFKIPILLFDFMGMYFLIKMFPDKKRYIGMLYFLSPIVLYSSYMHGQLDIIPTSFLIGSIYYLLKKGKKNYIISSILLAASLSTKMHILAVVPIIFIYLYKRKSFKSAIAMIAATFFMVIAISASFISNVFIKDVLFNSEQGSISQVYFTVVGMRIYIPILALILVYISAFYTSKINKDLLLCFCGIVFSVFLLLLPPMPGWYVWIVPFITIFFINTYEDKYKNLVIFVLLNGFYLVFFLFAHRSNYVDLYFLNHNLDGIKIHNDFICSLLFTILSGFLLYTIALMYKYGIRSNSLYKRGNKPFTIGISGDSGSGKSSFIERLKECLGEKNLLFIEGDGDHKWERGEDMWNKYTHLNPKANFLYRQASNIKMLRNGSSINRVDYDHYTGKFTSVAKIKPNRYIILCGLHSLYLPQMRKTLDLKVYLDTDETLRRYWKISRDTKSRGYSKEKILEQIESRVGDAEKYIYPQKEYADVVIQYFDKNLSDCFVENHKVVVSLKLTISTDIDLDCFICELEKYGIEVNHDYSENLQKQIIIIDGESLAGKSVDCNLIANNIIPQLDELTLQKISSGNNMNNILEALMLLVISYIMMGEN